MSVSKFSAFSRLLLSVAFLSFFSVQAAVKVEADDGARSPWTYWMGGGAYFLEGGEANKSSQLYEARVGYDVNRSFTVEWGIGGGPFFEENNYNAPSSRETDYNRGRNAPGENWMVKSNVGLLYHLNKAPNRKLDPYLSVVGGGSVWGKVRESGNLHPYAGPGAGLSYWFNDDLAVRGDYSMLWTQDEENRVNHQALLMLFYRFGDFSSSKADHSGAGVTKDGGVGPDNLGASTTLGLKTVYFDFDRSELRADTQKSLKENAQWMKQNPAKIVSLEGHCDERGTVEYNLALGNRRAKATYDYLRNLGTPSEQLTTMSFGEEFPEDSAHNEAAWAKNRRVTSVVK